jgi:hypothetical protein
LAIDWLKKAANLNFVHAKALLALQPNGASDVPAVVKKEGMLSKQGGTYPHHNTLTQMMHFYIIG